MVDRGRSRPREHGPDFLPVPLSPEVGANISKLICGRLVDAMRLRLQDYSELLFINPSSSPLQPLALAPPLALLRSPAQRSYDHQQHS